MSFTRNPNHRNANDRRDVGYRNNNNNNSYAGRNPRYAESTPVVEEPPKPIDPKSGDYLHFKGHLYDAAVIRAQAKASPHIEIGYDEMPRMGLEPLVTRSREFVSDVDAFGKEIIVTKYEGKYVVLLGQAYVSEHYRENCVSVLSAKHHENPEQAINEALKRIRIHVVLLSNPTLKKAMLE